MAGGGGLGPTEPGFLDLPTFAICAVLAFFLLASMAFEKATHYLIRFLKKRKRNGLAQAVTNLVAELTLVGFVSLLLIVLQGPISKICVPYSNGPYNQWNLISNVHGCDCCLKYTATVSSCFLTSRDCGPDKCNCDAKNQTCVVEPPSLSEIFEEWTADDECAAASQCSLAYLQRAKDSPQAELAVEALALECDGTVEVDTQQCGEGSAPLITVTAQHQIHIFIFCVAVTHVTMGCLMVLLASWRLRGWRQMCPDDDEDEHSRHVRSILDGSGSGSSRQGGRMSGRWKQLVGAAKVAKLTTFGSRQGRSLSAPAAALIRQVADVEAAASGAAAVAAARGEQPASVTIEVVGSAALPRAGSAGAGGEDKLLKDSSSSAGSTQAKDGQPPAGGPAQAGGHAEPPMQPQQPGSAAGEGQPKEEISGQDALLEPGTQGGAAATEPPVPVAAQEQQQEPAAPAGQKQQPTRNAFLNRSGTLQRNDHLGWAAEWATCALHLANPRPVAPEDIRLMRAAFMLTHRVPAGFDFWRFVGDSMEDDFAQIVGVSLEMWCTLVIFVLISGPLGWIALLGLCLAAAVLVLINIKLFQIIRHVCRGCRVNQLTSNVFWFNRPSLLLHPIKWVLFLCSFIFGSTLFFVWSFGAHSCPLSSRGNAFWFAWSAPWWVSLIAAGLVFLDASVRTLPCYSLAVQMGSEFKHHMLPKGVREKLLVIAAHIKEKHKSQRAAQVGGGSFRASTQWLKNLGQ